MKNSVWTFPYSKRYYLTHPWKWFKELWRNCRDAYRRARYGYTYVDVWNWYSWFLKTTIPMFRYLADKGCAYPCDDDFDTPEKWEEWLRHMADLLESGSEEWQEAHNEYHDEYMSHIMDDWKPPIKDENGNLVYTTQEPSDLDKKYWARAKELHTQGHENVKEAFAQIAKNFYALWD